LLQLLVEHVGGVSEVRISH